MIAKEVTIYDIAKELNVSASTVSRALNNNALICKSTTKRIIEKAGELGYRPNNFASNLRRQKTNTIGVVLHELNSSFITSVLAGIENVTAEAGYDIIITHSKENHETEVANVKNLYNKRVDGIIVSLSLTSKNLDHFAPFVEKKTPIVFFDRVNESTDIPHVVIDNYNCGYIATKHLLEQGCKRIAILTSNLKRNVYYQRHRGYTDALLDAKIKYDEAIVLVKDLTEESGIEAAHEILNMQARPDGLFVTNDLEAVLCMQELMLHGVRIPEDLAVVGFNNDAISKIANPKLSTIDYPGQQMGEATAKNLINFLNGNRSMGSINKTIIKSELLIRESSMRKK